MISALQKGAQMRPDTLSPPVIPSHTCPVQPRRTPHQRSQSLRLQAQKQANKTEVYTLPCLVWLILQELMCCTGLQL